MTTEELQKLGTITPVDDSNGSGSVSTQDLQKQGDIKPVSDPNDPNNEYINHYNNTTDPQKKIGILGALADHAQEFASKLMNNPIVQHFNPEKNIIEGASNLIQGGMGLMSKAEDLPIVREPFEAVGGLVGAGGAAIGGTLGAVAETGRQTVKAVQGKGFDVGQIGKTAVDTAKKTAEFGYNIGKSGAKTLPLVAGIAAVPEVAATTIISALSGSQIVKGGQEFMNKDYLNGLSDITLGALGFAGIPGLKAMKEKGLIDEGTLGKTLKERLNKGEDLKTAATKTEKVLNTPEKDLHKLTASERDFYFSSKRAEVEAASKKAETTVKENLQKQADSSQKEAESLNKQLQTASRDKVIELRPKIREALGKQSQEYRKLVNEELAPYRNNKVDESEFSSYIDKKFINEPEKSQVIKDKLGLGPKTKGGSSTIGQIYDKAQSLKQDIGVSARKGVRTYTSEEKLTDDTVSMLNDFMKSKGVDLKQSREFWAKYAPVRDQLVNESKPFVQAPIKTSKLASTLTKVASGKDINNANFISETEKLLGEKVTTEQEQILSKLDANKKQKLANEIDAQLKQDAIKAEKDKSLKGLTTKQFEVAQKARRRDIIKKIIGTGIAAGIGYEAKGVLENTGKLLTP